MSETPTLKKKITRKFTATRQNFGLIRTNKIVERISKFPDFPSSKCSPSQYLNLTLIGNEFTYKTLLEAAGREVSPKLSMLTLSEEGRSIAVRLEKLFKKYGSDKSTNHNYHEIYGQIISEFELKETRILEIGLGSNNSDTPSNMGIYGKPGASLRSWRDLNEGVLVVGADIDKRVLFEEERISTHFLDQLSDESWKIFKNELARQTFDLIIDDGLHSPIANLNTIKYLVSQLNPNGVMVIEDIAEQSLPVWTIFSLQCPENWKTEILKTKSAYVFILKPGNN
jgi:hypothetical protein